MQGGSYPGGGPQPGILKLAAAVRQFGAQAVYGRTMTAVEIAGIQAADGLENIWLSRENYRDKEGKKNWVEWSAIYPRQAGWLAALEKQLNE